MTQIVRVAVVVVAMCAAPVAQTRNPTGGGQEKTPPIRKPPSPTYPVPAAQTVDPALEQLVKQYETAFNKQDAKALAMLYTDNAVRLANQVLTGRAAIEGFYVTSFAGASKPSTLTVRVADIEMLTPDVAVMHGTYEVAGTSVTKGVYVATVVRQSGQWKMASLVPVPDTK